MSFCSLKIKRFFIALTVLFATATTVLAEENVISSVVISKAKDNANGYELNIDSTQAVQYKSHIDSDGNVYFDLKNSVLAADMGTIYDDVSNIDNVSVKQMNGNKVRIYVNGRNARNTDLIFVNSMFETKKESAKNIVINRPIHEYKSTVYQHADLEDQEEIQDWDDNSFNFSYLSSTILSELKDGVWGKILILLLSFAILVMVIKILALKLMQDREPLIGLNNAKMDEEIKIGSSNVQRKIVKNQDFMDISSRSETLRQAQLELSKAHQKYQQYIQNKYQGVQRPKTIDADILKRNIALNQYQKSTQNPYKNQEVIKMNNSYTSDITPKGNYQIPPRPKMERKSEFTSPYIQRTNNLVGRDIVSDIPKTNMKFLESVTKIYEQSGRSDLADGLKNSISKAKQTI